jgi:hypothetical protein
MSRLLVKCLAAAALLAGAVGCCAGPCRFYENAYGWNNPDREKYCVGPPPPVTTPPGYSTAVDPDQLANQLARPSQSVSGASDYNSPDELPPSEMPPPKSSSPDESSPTRVSPPSVMPAAHAERACESDGDSLAPARVPPPRWVTE